MVNVIVNQSSLGLGDSLFNRMKLLGDIHAGPLLLNHGDYRPKMALDPSETLHNCGMALM